MDDKLYTYYIEGENVRARRLSVAGIYQTNFSAYDDLFLITDLYTVNRLNNWKPEQVSGLELEVADLGSMNSVKEEIRERMNMAEPITLRRWKRPIRRYSRGSICWI